MADKKKLRKKTAHSGKAEKKAPPSAISTGKAPSSSAARLKEQPGEFAAGSSTQKQNTRPGQRAGDSAAPWENIFSASDPPAAGPKYFFTTDIPDKYDETYMRAIPRDPEWLFTYWEISEPTMADVKKNMGAAAFGSAKKILRLYMAEGDQYVDREIDAFANNWYMSVPEPGRAYYAECGFLTLDGRYFAAVRSNIANVPRYGVSRNTDQEWVSATTGELIRLSAGRLRMTTLGASEKRYEKEEEEENSKGIGGVFHPAAGSGSGMFGNGRG